MYTDPEADTPKLLTASARPGKEYSSKSGFIVNFITDKENQADGFAAAYAVIDPESAARKAEIAVDMRSSTNGKACNTKEYHQNGGDGHALVVRRGCQIQIKITGTKVSKLSFRLKRSDEVTHRRGGYLCDVFLTEVNDSLVSHCGGG